MGGQLTGQTAIVTGSTSGIGKATAVLFAQEGANVVVTGRRAELGEQVVQEITSRWCRRSRSRAARPSSGAST